MVTFIIIIFLSAFTFVDSSSSSKASFQTNPGRTMSPAIKLSYFDIEGAGEPVRLALILSGTPFEDDRIKFPDWPALKATTPYGQVPVMTIDNGPMKTQSGAMLRHIGATYSSSLYPRENIFEVEEAMGVVEDMASSWKVPLYMGMKPETFGYPEGFGSTPEGKAASEKIRKEWVAEELPKYMNFLIQLLKRQGEGGWLASTAAAGPTIVDCKAVPMVRAWTRGFIEHVPKDCLDAYPEIVDYIKRFCALDPIKGRYTDGIC